MDGNEEHITSLNYADGLIRKLKAENKKLIKAVEAIKDFAEERKEINIYMESVYCACLEALEHEIT
jgi:hypothetical protein